MYANFDEFKKEIEQIGEGEKQTVLEGQIKDLQSRLRLSKESEKNRIIEKINDTIGRVAPHLLIELAEKVVAKYKTKHPEFIYLKDVDIYYNTGHDKDYNKLDQECCNVIKYDIHYMLESRSTDVVSLSDCFIDFIRDALTFVKNGGGKYRERLIESAKSVVDGCRGRSVSKRTVGGRELSSSPERRKYVNNVKF